MTTTACFTHVVNLFTYKTPPLNQTLAHVITI